MASPGSSAPQGTAAAAAEAAAAEDAPPAADRMIFIGDIHGHTSKMESLWRRLEEHYGPDLADITAVFLGDYCDRGPDTKGVLSFLVSLAGRRAPGRTVFLAGNHDFGFAAYIGALPEQSPHSEHDLDRDTMPPCARNGHGYFAHPVEGGMHYMGRRWGGSEVYNARQTFESYGVQFAFTPTARAKLCKAVPESHKLFLRNMLWLYDAPVSFPPGRVLCAHAGLRSKQVEEQIASLKARDLWDRVTQAHCLGRLDALSGRREVFECPPSLRGRAIVVSGHHGTQYLTDDRIIIDESGGFAEIPLAAIALPSREVFLSDVANVIQRQKGVMGLRD